MLHENCGFGTKAIHAGNVKDAQYGALTTPIFQTSTFVFDSCEQGGRRFAGQEGGYIYTRLGNPTTSVLEAKIAALENGEACVAAASGMGAISSALWTVAGAGKHIVADGTLYGCTFALLNHGMTRYGVEVSFVDTSDLDAVRAALKPNTCAVYLETPANPNLKIADIAAVADIAHGYSKDIKIMIECQIYICQCLCLNSLGSIHHKDGAIAGCKASRYLVIKIDMSRGVDEIDVGIFPANFVDRTADRDPALALLIHKIHRGLSVVDFRNAIRTPRIEQDAFTDRRLAGIDVRHDANIAYFICAFTHRHRLSPLNEKSGLGSTPKPSGLRTPAVIATYCAHSVVCLV